MNIEHFKKRLQDKQRELESSLATLESEGRDFGEAEVRDSTDDATTSQATSESFDEGTILSQTLEQVRNALDRIQNGTFGKCVDCGRPIEPARLEAIPWTPYCLAHQEKHDRAASAN